MVDPSREESTAAVASAQAAHVRVRMGATLFNIAAGEPFTPVQVLWIPLRGQRPVRLRARLRPGTPRAHGPQAASSGRAGADHAGDGHGRARRAGRHHRPAFPDPSRAVTLRQPPHRQLDRVHVLRALPDRGRPRMPQRDRHGADHRHLRQQADELGGARRVRPRGARHRDGRPPAPARHHPDQHARVRVGARARHRAPGRSHCRRRASLESCSIAREWTLSTPRGRRRWTRSSTSTSKPV